MAHGPWRSTTSTTSAPSILYTVGLPEPVSFWCIAHHMAGLRLALSLLSPWRHDDRTAWVKALCYTTADGHARRVSYPAAATHATSARPEAGVRRPPRAARAGAARAGVDSGAAAPRVSERGVRRVRRRGVRRARCGSLAAAGRTLTRELSRTQLRACISSPRQHRPRVRCGRHPQHGWVDRDRDPGASASLATPPRIPFLIRGHHPGSATRYRSADAVTPD